MSTEILIIDDESGVRDVMAMYLKSLGYPVTTAKDGISGVEAFRRLDPALVLCDLRMPGMDGLEVLAVLTQERPETPVIVVSGMGGMGDAIQALKLGAWDYVTKPIEDFAVLDHAVRRALERARLRAEVKAYREHLEAANAKLQASLRQLQNDEAAGRMIQFRLLPPERQVFDGYECSRHLVTSAILSGDFIDYFAIDGQHFGFYMADVAGHGVSSALITILLKSYMGRHVERHRQHGVGTILDPAALLAGLNREILADHHGKHITMFYGVVNAAAARLDFSNAGQYPFPVLHDRDGTRPIGGNSAPVGLFEDASYRTQSLAITAPFSLAMFSDGILETLPQPDLAAKHAVLHALPRELDAAALARALGLERIEEPPDDISVFALRKLAHG